MKKSVGNTAYFILDKYYFYSIIMFIKRLINRCNYEYYNRRILWERNL